MSKYTKVREPLTQSHHSTEEKRNEAIATSFNSYTKWVTKVTEENSQ